MLTGIIVFLGLSLLVLAHEAGHFLVARFFKMKVEEFGFGFPPRIFAWKKGEVEYSVNWLLFGGFVRIAGENDSLDPQAGEPIPVVSEEERSRFFFAQKPWKRSLVTLAGVAVNFVFGWLLLSGILMVGTPRMIVADSVQKASPAEAVGIQPGDIIKGFVKSADFIAFVNEHRGQETEFIIRRDGKDISLRATPRAVTAPGEGALGVSIAEAGMERQPFFAALRDGFSESIAIMGATFTSFYDLVKGLFFHGALLPGVVGPVGIFSVANQTGKIGFIYLLQLLALISLNLSALNLLPLPALDGGRFVLILIEKIKGSPLSRKIEMWANGAGFIFLIGLIILITIRDVSRLF